MPIATPSIPNAIPSDWNITTFSTPESRPADEMPGEPVPPPRPLRAGPVRAPVPPEPQAPRISPELRPELRPGGRPAMRRVPPAPGVPPAVGAPAAAPPQAVRQPEHPAAQQAPGAPGLDLGALLRAAGVDPSTVPPETADTLGKILRIAVQGTLDTLRARDEVKAQFRLAVTRVRQTENNPLSFAVDADDAINLLLNRRNPAYLPPVEAFERAFDDIRAHQVAMLVGLRAGVTSMMNRLDPKQLEEDFEKQAKRGRLLGASPRSKFWELYEAHFDQLRGDRDDAFRRLFGEEFARAYEQQIDALKTKRSVRKS
jgi:type VI secretion system FHA domain protein